MNYYRETHECHPVRTVSPSWVSYVCLGCGLRWGHPTDVTP